MIERTGYLSSSLPGVGLMLMVMLIGQPATAFDYAEHYAITVESLHRACAAFTSDNGPARGEQERTSATETMLVERLCSSERAVACLAHMAAVAGDYAVRPKEFEKPDSYRMSPLSSDTFAATLAATIDRLVREDVDEVVVASVPMEHSFLAFCSFFVNCNKLEIVVINSAKATHHIDHVVECKAALKEQPETAHAALYACYDTKEHVLRAAETAQGQFLRRLSRKSGAEQGPETSVPKLLPAEYAPIDLTRSSEMRGTNALNSDPLLLS